MKIICKHNGIILDKYGLNNKNIEIKETLNILSDENINKIKQNLSFRGNEFYDFEYGIGGSPTDEYYKIKNIKLSNNDTEIIVRVSKIG